MRYTLYLSNIFCSSFSYFLITTTSFFLLETIKRSFKCEMTIVCRNDCFRSSAITKWQITQTTHYSKLYHCKTFLLIGFYSNVKKKRGWSHHFTTREKKSMTESVYRRRTDNTMAKRKSTKGQTTIYKAYT